ncbi:MAG: signal peptidase I [Alphaproteobacteria bacterium]|nr:MAG: signal peptidase I [Alphaproteobacteria bacterium]
MAPKNLEDFLSEAKALFEKWVLRPIRHRRAALKEHSAEVDKNPAREIIEIVVSALVIAFVFKWFLFQPFNIPSGSMKPTLLIGDYVFVSKYSYGYSSKSFFSGIDLFDGRILAATPKRGDIVVFKKTSDGKTDFIKRLIGLPGDKIQMKRGVLYINGVAVSKTPDGSFFDDDPRNGFSAEISAYMEMLPNGVLHETLDEYPDMPLDDTGVFTVPQGHYFMMGDNRDNSSDSRDPRGGVNFVPEENLVGRAELIFMSVDGSAKLWQIWKWPGAIRYNRLFTRL